MSHLAVATSLGMLIALNVACAGENRAPKPDAGKAHVVDASSSDADAGAEEEPNLNSLLIAELIETEGSLVARCPCLTASGMYQSMADCTKAVTLGRNWVDCANSLDLSAHDDAQTRADLHCNIEELKQRSQCLMGSSCSDSDIVACMTASLNCRQLALELLSQFAVQCQVAFSR